jgi:hypothetical protein
MNDMIQSSMAGYMGTAPFGANVHRNAPLWLTELWKTASKDWQNRYGQAGTNVTDKCPSGGKVEFATETRDGKRRYRWLCQEPAGKSPTQVWDRERGEWDARQLFCPATRGYGMTTSIACNPKHPKGNALKTIAKVALAPVAIPGAIVAKKAFQLLTRPLRKNINKLKHRRALKLAWDKRKSTTPTQPERQEAKTWAKSKLKSKGPHGYLLSLLAGPPDAAMSQLGLSANFGATGAEEAAIAASIPILIKMLQELMQSLIKSGEIRAVVQAGAEGYIEERQAEADTMAEEAPAGVESDWGGAPASTSNKWGLGLLIAGGVVVTGLGVYAMRRGPLLDLPVLR